MNLGFEEVQAAVGSVEGSVEVLPGEPGGGEPSGADGPVAGDGVVDGGCQRAGGPVDLAGPKHDLALGGAELGVAVPGEPARELVPAIPGPQVVSAVEGGAGLLVLAVARKALGVVEFEVAADARLHRGGGVGEGGLDLGDAFGGVAAVGEVDPHLGEQETPEGVVADGCGGAEGTEVVLLPG